MEIGALVFLVDVEAEDEDEDEDEAGRFDGDGFVVSDAPGFEKYDEIFFTSVLEGVVFCAGDLGEKKELSGRWDILADLNKTE